MYLLGQLLQRSQVILLSFRHGMGSILYPDGKFITGVWTQGILTEAMSKVMEQNREEPLDEPKSRGLKDRHLVRAFGVN